MKATILAGALAALTYGTAAFAQDEAPAQGEVSGEESQAPDVIVIEPVAPSEQEPGQEQGIGGAGAAGMEPQKKGELLLRCEPVPSATGGAGLEGAGLEGAGPPSAGPEGVCPPQGISPEGEQLGQVPIEEQQPVVQQEPEEEDLEEAYGGAGLALEEEKKGDMRGLTVLVGAGIEGYSNALAPRVNPGPAVSVLASFKPTTVLGIEVGYTGAVNNLDTGIDDGATSGPDLIRNGGQAVATLGLMASEIQPYVLGGIGLSDYNVRGVSEGFVDDTVGNVPLGAGVRGHFGNFTADARIAYNLLFDQEFASAVPTTDIGAPGDSEFSEGGSYLGTVNVGLTF